MVYSLNSLFDKLLIEYEENTVVLFNTATDAVSDDDDDEIFLLSQL